MTTRPTGTICGLYLDDGTLPLTFDDSADDRPRCDQELARTESPASALHCAVHGDVLDCRPAPPLSGTVHLNYGGGRGEMVDLAELARRG